MPYMDNKKRRQTDQHLCRHDPEDQLYVSEAHI